MKVVLHVLVSRLFSGLKHPHSSSFDLKDNFQADLYVSYLLLLWSCPCSTPAVRSRSIASVCFFCVVHIHSLQQKGCPESLDPQVVEIWSSSTETAHAWWQLLLAMLTSEKNFSKFHICFINQVCSRGTKIKTCYSVYRVIDITYPLQPKITL